MASDLTRGIKVSDLARWEWCNEEAYLRCHGVERETTIYDRAGTRIHKAVVRAPQTPTETLFLDKLHTQRPFFREVQGVKIFGGVDAIDAEGLEQGVVRFIECKTRGERTVPPFLIKPAIFQLQIYAWLFQPIVEKIGYQLAKIHYVDFVHRESMEILQRHPCIMNHDIIGEKVSRIISLLLKNEHILGAKDIEPWKCTNCAVAFKNKCRFWPSATKESGQAGI